MAQRSGFVLSLRGLEIQKENKVANVVDSAGSWVERYSMGRWVVISVLNRERATGSLKRAQESCVWKFRALPVVLRKGRHYTDRLDGLIYPRGAEHSLKLKW